MAGWPLPGVEIRVVDLHLRDVARDMQAVGEVVIRGDEVMDGYFGDERATAAAISDGGWLHTGDMAVWDEDGYINIVDRKKDIIISGGENISSLEVEKAIFAHPAVLECAVVPAPDARWGEVPAAFVVLKQGQKLTGDELQSFLAAAHRAVQDSADDRVPGGAAAEDGHREDDEARTAGQGLGGGRAAKMTAEAQKSSPA